MSCSDSLSKRYKQSHFEEYVHHVTPQAKDHPWSSLKKRDRISLDFNHGMFINILLHFAADRSKLYEFKLEIRS